MPTNLSPGPATGGDCSAYAAAYPGATIIPKPESATTDNAEATAMGAPAS
jgi:hypothetical protein